MKIKNAEHKLSNSDFVALSKQMVEVKKVVNLVKGIKVDTIIIGETGTGKSKIAKSILPEAIIINGENTEDVLKGLKSFNEVIIENFDKIRNYDILHMQDQKIVATASKKPKDSVVDKFFGIVIELDPLSKRVEDIKPLMVQFLEDAKESLKIDSDISSEQILPDISQNCHSLKRSVYKKLLGDSLDEAGLTNTMSDFFFDRIETDDNYSHFLAMFDKAIIIANYKKFKSQLMMSYKMGINRNTLRKKINELELKLDE